MTRREALEILGLDADASLDQARMAYRELAKVYHPDKNAASNAAVMFRIISDAWDIIQKDSVQAHTETEAEQERAKEEATRRRAAENAARERAEAEAQRRRAEEEAARRRAQYEAQRKQAEEARRKTEAARAAELRGKEKEIEDKIWLRSYAVWFVVCFSYFCIVIIGNFLGIGGFVGSEPWDIGDIFTLLFGSMLMACFLGSITGAAIVKVRKWFQ